MYMNKAVLYVKLKGPQCSDIQGAQHMISVQKKNFSSRSGTEVGCHGPPGIIARAQL